ncbi:putative polyketide synthase [Trichoderma cornu-damae]|uniref:Polyketide synthase n=1 Tax=Trichoderma cornu-damae TaxID=654480 RepID=A0A9P8QP06_9HYPO|nr:putative polyketide synthase [Trichoderma cornu-damae]
METTDDIAIVGFSFKLPQDVEDDTSFWDVLYNQKNLMTEWPESRLNASSFVANKQSKIQCRGGHFIKQDVATFDAPFFSITAKEAASMDPMQRWTLETSYRAFEKAGIPVERLRGSRTAVFSATMTEDWARMVGMDPDNAERTVATGTVASLIPNRVSFYFDLHGPSIHVDTACSGSLSAIDMACKVLRDGDASAALVTGSNLALDPSTFQMLSSQGFLSPDSLCYSFDHRANGYARGEGIIAFVLKPVSAAIRDGDMIRAVIRSSASNQDGHTPGLTQPSPEAQEALIRHVYQKANLSFDQTRYVEAHGNNSGTGTLVGDPIEIKGIGRVFRKYRSIEDPLYVGSVKGNIGHLEGASGLAGILKSILMLEKGIIPPNANFEKISPRIDADFYNITVPKQSTAWPSAGIRRISVNSFGFGGSNTHVILDDAMHYLQEKGLSGNHCTAGAANAAADAADRSLDATPRDDNLPRLLVWSAKDEKAIKRTTLGYEGYYAAKSVGDAGRLDKLAFTLANRRSHMLWRTFAIANSGPESAEDARSQDVRLSAARPVRSSSETALAFVFTGQGAQYVNMGWDLLKYPVFASFMRKIDDIYRELGSKWSVFDELRSRDNIDRPEYSQPLSTAVQIALVELLKSFGILPGAVVGHSSGEITAAYAIGALSLVSACKVSYFRGQFAGKLRAIKSTSPGAMLSVNLAEDRVAGYLADVKADDVGSVRTACINSPTNCTLSGPEGAIKAIKAQADKDGIFAHVLMTGVAYHSPSMQEIADDYLVSMGNLGSDGSVTRDAKAASTACPMVSSVSGKIARPATLATAQYWVENLVSPVRFSTAIQTLTQTSSLKVGLGRITDIVEIGPHPALRRPVLDTVAQPGNKNNSVRYSYALHRTEPAVETVLKLVGELFCHGHAGVSISAANQQADSRAAFLIDCPEYPFDHSLSYWAESRISRDFRLREPVSGETLGMRVTDWNPLQPRWRAFLATESLPWIAHHVVSDNVLYPAAGMLVMAMEAVQQMALQLPGREISGYLVKEARFMNPIVVREAFEDRIEVQTHLSPAKTQQHEKEATWFDVAVMSYFRGRWTECCRTTIQVQYKASADIDGGEGRRLADMRTRSRHEKAKKACTQPVDSQVYYQDAAKVGLKWGDWFQVLQDIFLDSKGGVAVARVDASKARYQTTSIVHPAILDVVFHMLRIGAGQLPATNVPVRLRDAWFAPTGWQQPQTQSIHWLGFARGSKMGEHGSVYALADDGTVLCAIQEAATAAVSMDHGLDGSTEPGNKKTLVHRVEWKPQLSLLNPKELASVCHAEAFTKDEAPIIAGSVKLNSLLDIAVARTLGGIVESHLAKLPVNLRRHVEWMERHVGRMSPSRREEANAISDEEMERRLCEIDAEMPEWKVYTAVARSLPAILAAEVDPLQIVFESDLASVFYAHVFESICADGRLARFLDLASHENPAMRILEVGAGTGGVTGHVMRALQDREARTGTLSFAEFTYTDVSPVFLEGARNRWPELLNRMVFKTLDLEADIAQQGFEPGTYDLIIAGCVLHATPSLEATLRNVRTALRPGGRLLLLEVINPDDIATNFWSGLVPSWWVAREEWRPYSAAIPEKQWDTCLRATGFSGSELVIRDYQSDQCHFMSIIVSTAVEQGPGEQPADDEAASAITSSREEATAGGCQPSLVFIVDDEERQKDLVKAVLGHLNPDGNRQSAVRAFSSLDQAEQTSWEDGAIAICLAEVNSRPLVASLSDERSFGCLQRLVKQAPRLLWATSTGIDDELYPHYGVIQGFLRTIRAEQPHSDLVSVAIEGQADIAACARYISTVFHATFESSLSEEVEYIVRDGQIMVGRASVDGPGNTSLQALLYPQLQHLAWKDSPALRLDVGTPGALDSLRLVYDAAHESPLGPEEIEIEAFAWGLNFRDVLIALGRYSETQDDLLGADCAGIVTRVGRACSGSVRVGDRVCMLAEACMRKYPRAHETRVIGIPDSLSFESAASLLVPALTSYHALVNVAQLQPGETVLIHSAAGSTGQMAVRIAQMLGAKVFATTSSPDKKRFLVDTLSIPEDCIFHSRTTSFAESVMQHTQGRGVDCVLNSLSGDGLRASWECMAPFGRFVDIGNADIKANAMLPMAMFAKNVSFSAVHLMWLKPSVTARLLESTMQLLDQGKILPPQPIRSFGLRDAEQAFRVLQSGKNIGRIVIAPEPDELVPQLTLERRPWTFDEKASYLVVGGFGGLGRAILMWMADRGAKHIIVPSRSGAASKAAVDLIDKLTARGVHIMAPECDASSGSSLEGLLAECVSKGLPPIKGCINSAMVLQDAIFENMTFAQWELTVKSKAQTAWNLHRLLPNDLDFFILLSSLAGVVGQPSSANYTAGCAFQDALAHQRVLCGQKALSLDIGWMRNIGIIAETAAYQRRRQADQDLQSIDDIELLAMLTMCCDPANPLSHLSLEASSSQVLFGLRTPADFIARDQTMPAHFEVPFFAGFSFVPSSAANQEGYPSAQGNQPAVLFRQATDPDERGQIVLSALAAKLAVAMSIAPGDVESSKPLSNYGVDSLMAIELRNWIGREFSVKVSVFDIMGGQPLSSIANMVSERSLMES